jgi:hypothetical protein
MAPTLSVTSTATISAQGGAGGSSNGCNLNGGAGGLGRIRISTTSLGCPSLAGSFNPPLATTSSCAPASTSGDVYIADDYYGCGPMVFTETGSAQWLTIPSGVTSVAAKLWGAGGGGGGATGNGGGFTTAALTVTPGEVLTLIVGGKGIGKGQANVTLEPYGGGGAGSTGGSWGGAASGGGRSAIRSSTTGPDLLTAGGGGASGDSTTLTGAGGGTSGQVGSGTAGASAGTQTAGGIGGLGSCSATRGNSGAQYQGADSYLNGGNPWGAGAGGGGYYGGGSGGYQCGQWGGGAGGSGFIGGTGVVVASTTAGSGSAAAGTSDLDYATGIGVGGAAGASGGNGLIVLYLGAGPSFFQPLFFDDFQSLTSSTTGSQCATGDVVYAEATLSQWTITGFHAIHGVQWQTATGNLAAQFYDGDSSDLGPNELVMTTGVAANQSGVGYTVHFLGGPANWSTCTQGNVAGGGLVFSVLRTNSTVLQTYTYSPPVWVSVATEEALTANSFTYTGDGSGNVKLQITTAGANDGHFGGALDDVEITSP